MKNKNMYWTQPYCVPTEMHMQGKQTEQENIQRLRTLIPACMSPNRYVYFLLKYFIDLARDYKPKQHGLIHEARMVIYKESMLPQRHFDQSQNRFISGQKVAMVLKKNIIHS